MSRVYPVDLGQGSIIEVQAIQLDSLADKVKVFGTVVNVDDVTNITRNPSVLELSTTNNNQFMSQLGALLAVNNGETFNLVVETQKRGVKVEIAKQVLRTISVEEKSSIRRIKMYEHRSEPLNDFLVATSYGFALANALIFGEDTIYLDTTVGTVVYSREIYDDLMFDALVDQMKRMNSENKIITAYWRED